MLKAVWLWFTSWITIQKGTKVPKNYQADSYRKTKDKE